MHCQPEYKHEVYIWSKSIQPCLICDESTESAEAVCSACETELPWLMEQCERCALPLPMEGSDLRSVPKTASGLSPSGRAMDLQFSRGYPGQPLQASGALAAGYLLARLPGSTCNIASITPNWTRPDCLLPGAHGA